MLQLQYATRRPKPLAIYGVFALLQSSISYAQEDTTLEPMTIVVTARHTAEDINDIPFTVNFLQSQQIKEKQQDELGEVLESVPGVQMTSNGDTSSANIRIRGIGSLNKSSVDDNAVTFYVDGLAQPSGAASLSTLDINYIEVLKGPQGTLFGQNAMAGAVNIVSNTAGFYKEGSLETGIGNNNHRFYEGMFNTPLSET